MHDYNIKIPYVPPPPPPPEPEPIPYVWNPTHVVYDQQFIVANVSSPHFYMIFKQYPIKSYRGFISCTLVMAMAGLLVEGVKFLKWYITVRKRITYNCMKLMVNLSTEDEQTFDDSIDLQHLNEYELDIGEKCIVSFLFIFHRLI